MKKLILITLLISLNCFASRTHDEINALKVNDVVWDLLHRAYPDCKFSVKKDFDYENPVTFADIINDLETEECAATLPTLETELVKYKTEAHTDLTYREVLATKKAEAKTLYGNVKQHYHSAASKAGLQHVSNPAAWYRDNCKQVNTHELIDACLSKLTLVKNKIPEIEAEIAAIEQEETDCKNYRKIISNASLEQFVSSPDANKWQKVFQVLKCITKEQI